MKQYIQKSDKESRVINAQSKASRQASLEEILQTYTTSKTTQQRLKNNVVQAKSKVLQRAIDPEILEELSLDTPVFQLPDTTACWFLSLLYGIQRAGWVKSLFVDGVIQVKKIGGGKYICTKDRIIIVEVVKDGRPLWQQILEGFILSRINDEKENFIGARKGGESFQRNVKKLVQNPMSDELQRGNLKNATDEFLKAICNDWQLDVHMSTSFSGANGSNSPFSEMTGLNYLTPFQKNDKQKVVFMTVEKRNHAMGVKYVTFKKGSVPGPRPSKKELFTEQKFVQISNVNVYNQQLAQNNIWVYNNSIAKKVEKVNTPKWAEQLNYYNCYKIERTVPENITTKDLFSIYKLQKLKFDDIFKRYKLLCVVEEDKAFNSKIFSCLSIFEFFISIMESSSVSPEILYNIGRLLNDIKVSPENGYSTNEINLLAKELAELTAGFNNLFSIMANSKIKPKNNVEERKM
ncbi:hypothetical protein [Bacteroides sp. 51]|uniref:hypothetical protein n=1 Tax=Bacteroides sp. 51 TaxID=2302938 RepID=UPI0013D4789A|nr:hypothetical protein [Bacteroides sp. 51]NDV81048.1 hypothetical protein [Bacteroides sp. 51]